MDDFHDAEESLKGRLFYYSLLIVFDQIIFLIIILSTKNVNCKVLI